MSNNNDKQYNCICEKCKVFMRTKCLYCRNYFIDESSFNYMIYNFELKDNKFIIEMNHFENKDVNENNQSIIKKLEFLIDNLKKETNIKKLYCNHKFVYRENYTKEIDCNCPN